MTTIEARSIHRAQTTPFWDDSAFGAFGAYPGRGPATTSDTFSIPGATYIRQDGKIGVRHNHAQELYRTKWFTHTFDAMVGLFRGPSTRSPSRVQLKLVARMLTILIEILDGQTPPPSVVPTWEGGLQVEWHRNGVDLEVEIAPNGHIEYFFASPDVECEGDAWDEIESLAEYAQAIV